MLQVTGLGILMIEREGSVYVASPPLEGSAGAKAGLKAGDQVLRVGSKDVTGLTSFQVAELLQVERPHGETLNGRAISSLLPTTLLACIPTMLLTCMPCF